MFDRGITRQRYGIGNAARNKRLHGSHHVKLRLNGELPAEYGKVFFADMRCVFQAVRAAGIGVGTCDLVCAEAYMAQHIEARIMQLRIVHLQHVAAEAFSQYERIKRMPQMRRTHQRHVYRHQLLVFEPARGQRFMANRRRPRQRAMAAHMHDNILNLPGIIAQPLQPRDHRAVELALHTAARMRPHFHQLRKRRHPGSSCIKQRQQPRARRHQTDLGVAITILVAANHRQIPHSLHGLAQTGIRQAGMVKRRRADIDRTQILRAAKRRFVMLPHQPHYPVTIGGISLKGAKLTRQLGGSGIAGAGHQRCHPRRHGPAFLAVIGIAHLHEHRAQVTIAQAHRAETVGVARNLARGILRHSNGDIEHHHQQAREMLERGDIKLARFIDEMHQIKRSDIAGRIIEEQKFPARAGRGNRPLFGAAVPGFDGIAELHRRLAGCPAGLRDLPDQLLGGEFADCYPVATPVQGPYTSFAYCMQKMIGHPYRHARLMRADGEKHLGIRLAVKHRQRNLAEALRRVILDARDVTFRHLRLARGQFRFGNRGLLARLKRRQQCLEVSVQLPRTGHQGCRFIFFRRFPAHEGFNLRVVDIYQHQLFHLRGTAARFNRPGRLIADTQETDQPAGIGAAGKRLLRTADGGHITARARAIFK